jgi:hypothetical protein
VSNILLDVCRPGGLGLRTSHQTWLHYRRLQLALPPPSHYPSRVPKPPTSSLCGTYELVHSILQVGFIPVHSYSVINYLSGTQTRSLSCLLWSRSSVSVVRTVKTNLIRLKRVSAVENYSSPQSLSLIYGPRLTARIAPTVITHRYSHINLSLVPITASLSHPWTFPPQPTRRHCHYPPLVHVPVCRHSYFSIQLF